MTLNSPKIRVKIQQNTKEYIASLKQRSPDAIAASQDFLKFREYVCQHKTYPHQLEWDKVLNTGQDNRYLKGIAGKNVCILAPRNSAKSTYLLQWVAWVIGTHVNAGISLKILYISYVIEAAASKSRQIKAIIESPAYREVFPRVRKSPTKWGENEWCIDFAFAGLRTVDEVYTVACAGLGGATNSRRSHLAIFDDIQKSPQEARNRTIQDRMFENYNNVIKFTRYEGGRFVCLGTRMSRFDAYERIFTPPEWDVITQRALLVDDQGNEHSFCEPSRNPDEQGLGISLATLRQERTSNLESFLLQRQNELPQEAFVGIRAHLIKYGWLPTEFERVVIGVDLASSLTGDYTAFVTIGVSKNKLYITDAYQERIQGNMKKVDILFDQWAKRGDTCRNSLILGVDHNKFAIDFEGDLTGYLGEMEAATDTEQKFKNMQIDRVKSQGRGDKIDRLMGHSLLFERERVYFNRVRIAEDSSGLSTIDKLVGQITNYNILDSNDLLDALEIGLYVARNFINSELTVAG